MRAVLLVAKGEGRRRIVSLIGLALIVGLVGVAVFASVAGARRTASAPDRLRATTVARDGGAFAFTLVRQGERIVDIELPLRGIHNVVNATGAAALAMAVGVMLYLVRVGG